MGTEMCLNFLKIIYKKVLQNKQMFDTMCEKLFIKLLLKNMEYGRI